MSILDQLAQTMQQKTRETLNKDWTPMDTVKEVKLQERVRRSLNALTAASSWREEALAKNALLKLLKELQEESRELDTPPAARPMNYQERVKQERNDLNEKIVKLSEFINTNPLYEGIPREESDRLLRQHRTMNDYLQILNERIAAFRVLATEPVEEHEETDGREYDKRDTEESGARISREGVRITVELL